MDSYVELEEDGYHSLGGEKSNLVQKVYLSLLFSLLKKKNLLDSLFCQKLMSWQKIDIFRLFSEQKELFHNEIQITESEHRIVSMSSIHVWYERSTGFAE